jgi:hypothetical protein
MPFTTTIYTDAAIGLTVTACPEEMTRAWKVCFLRRNTDLHQICQWLPGPGAGHWNRSRLPPSALPLIPPAALTAVEAWLAERAAVEVAK